VQPIQNTYRVLFLCTGNSARSQMAEAVLNLKGSGRLRAESAGSSPAARVNRYAIQALRESGINWQGHSRAALPAWIGSHGTS
jgi:arsenate reductase (thioredoxin)